MEELLEGLAEERSPRSREASFLASGAVDPTRIVQLADAPEGGFPLATTALFPLEPAVELEKPELFEGPE